MVLSTDNIWSLSAGQSEKAATSIPLGIGLEDGTLQDLSWSGWQQALLQLHDSASLRLEVNYTDRNQDSEGNMPGFQRGCYQDGAEQQPWDCTVSPSIVYLFSVKAAKTLK